MDLSIGEMTVTGIEDVDRQHSEYLKIAKSFVELCNKGGNPPDLIRGKFNEVKKYAFNHFAFEENLMDGADYPYLEEHRTKHNEFRVTMRSLDAQLQEAESVDTLVAVITLWLVNWFFTQIQNDDMKMANYFHEQLRQAREK